MKREAALAPPGRVSTPAGEAAGLPPRWQQLLGRHSQEVLLKRPSIQNAARLRRDSLGSILVRCGPSTSIQLCRQHRLRPPACALGLGHNPFCGGRGFVWGDSHQGLEWHAQGDFQRATQPIEIRPVSAPDHSPDTGRRARTCTRHWLGDCALEMLARTQARKESSRKR